MFTINRNGELDVKKLGKQLALLLTVCVMATCIAGCTGSFDATTFVKGSIDSLYLGVFDKEYLDIVVDTEEELVQGYEEGLQVEADYFFSYFDIIGDAVDPNMKSEVVEIYREIYSKSKYEVGNSTKSKDSYLVSVTIYPMDIMQKIQDEEFDGFVEVWSDREEYGYFDDMTDEEYETAWAREIIDMTKNRINSIGYLDPQTISVQVVVDTIDGEEYYTISENDALRIDELIIKY